MTAKIIEWDGEPFALLIETSTHGTFLVPPIVLDDNDRPVEGREILEAIVASGTPVGLPVIRNADPATLAEIDQRMAHLSTTMGVPIGPSASQ